MDGKSRQHSVKNINTPLSVSQLVGCSLNVVHGALFILGLGSLAGLESGAGSLVLVEPDNGSKSLPTEAVS